MKTLLGLMSLKKRAKRYDVLYKDKEYILVGSKKQGALFTKEQLDKGFIGGYYLYDDGKVRHNGEIVGTIKDIQFV